MPWHWGPDNPAVLIYDIEGELFFGAAPEIEHALDALTERVKAEGTQFVVLRLKRARNPDAVGIERIERFLHDLTELGVTVLLAGVRPDTLDVLGNVGLRKWFPDERIFPEGEKEFSATLKAVRYAESRLVPGGVSSAEELYYLV